MYFQRVETGSKSVLTMPCSQSTAAKDDSDLVFEASATGHAIQEEEDDGPRQRSISLGQAPSSLAKVTLAIPKQ